jgi:pimeloyl-ACP methyl ester carboxylesterase
VSTLQTVTSADGTPIAVERIGSGPTVVLIGGALNDRGSVAGLAAVLADGCTVLTYDRRGRGDSGDVPGSPSAREVEDLAAVLAAAGAPAGVFGHSSGAVLALEAAIAGLPLARLAVYEAPLRVEDAPVGLAEQARSLVAAGRRGDAVELFMVDAVGMPAAAVAGMRGAPMWPSLEGIAHTLPYDLQLVEQFDRTRLGAVAVPTMCIDGDRSPEWMRRATSTVAEAIPGARYLTLPDEDHSVLQRPEALRATLTAFFTI